MSAHDRMRDPYYAQIIFKIEGRIHDYDLSVRSGERIELKDSDIKSALRKAISLLRGSGALRPPKDQRDRLNGALASELVKIYEEGSEADGPSRAEYVDALLAVEDTLKIRRAMAEHSRGYLEFLEEFIATARRSQPDKTG